MKPVIPWTSQVAPSTTGASAVGVGLGSAEVAGALDVGASVGVAADELGAPEVDGAGWTERLRVGRCLTTVAVGLDVPAGEVVVAPALADFVALEAGLVDPRTNAPPVNVDEGLRTVE